MSARTTTLGHVGQPENPQAEGEADCWAIQLMMDGGMIKSRDFDQLRCLVFASRKTGASRKRYQELMKIFRAWLPTTWTSVEQEGTAKLVERQFLAQDSERNTVIELLTTSEARVYFLVRRVPPDQASVQLQAD